MTPDDEQAIDELARALASQHQSWTDLQDEAKRTLKRAHPHLGEAALAREHLIINQLRENQPHARDAVSAWLEGVDGTKGDPNAVSTITEFDGMSILFRAVSQLKVGTVRVLLSHGAKVESEFLLDLLATRYTPRAKPAVLPIVKDLIIHGSAGRDLLNNFYVTGTTVGIDIGHTPLMAAIAAQKYDVAKYLLHRGADINYTAPARDPPQPRSASDWAAYHAEESTYHHPTGADLAFLHFIRNVRRAGGWKPFVRAPRVSLVVLRSLCEKDRARPPPELARLFALNKFIFWRVLAFWRTDLDLPHHITTRKREPPQNEYFD